MSSLTIGFFKELSLPEVRQPNSIYLIGSEENADSLVIYVTGTNAEVVKHTLTAEEARAISQSVLTQYLAEEGGAQPSTLLVADIAERDALELSAPTLVLVKDATADATVGNGAATYVYDPEEAAFTKIAEYDSLDIVFNWAGLQDKPNSSVEEIDAAVEASHTHANADVLDSLGVDEEGRLTYGGQPVSQPTLGTVLTTAEW